MRKHLFGLSIVILILTGYSLPAAAEIPRLMSFQGRLCNAADSPVNGNYDFTFNIYDVASGGAALWTENQNGIPVENGVYNILLGSSTALNLAFDTSYWLGVAVAPDAEMTPRYRLTSAPYAFSSDTAATVTSGGSSGVQRYVVSGTFDTSVVADSIVYADSAANWLEYICVVDNRISQADMPAIQVYYEQFIVMPDTGIIGVGLTPVCGYGINVYNTPLPAVLLAEGKAYLAIRTNSSGLVRDCVLNNSKYYIVIIK